MTSPAQQEPAPLKCVRCGDGPLFLAPLHGDKGGPLMCVKCRVHWDQQHLKDLKQCPDWKRNLHGAGPRVFGNRELTYLTLELLNDAVALTHPDMHPPERAEKAKRVTAELLALKPYTLPKPEPKPAPTVTDKNPSAAADYKEPLRIEYPCETCFLTVPWYYCNTCRSKYDEIERKARDYKNRRQRERYARRKSVRGYEYWKKSPILCAACGKQFKWVRKDARFCSSACRQRAHRERVTANQTHQLSPLNSRDVRTSTSEAAS
jgi:hypothetical protein